MKSHEVDVVGGSRVEQGGPVNGLVAVCRFEGEAADVPEPSVLRPRQPVHELVGDNPSQLGGRGRAGRVDFDEVGLCGVSAGAFRRARAPGVVDANNDVRLSWL